MLLSDIWMKGIALLFAISLTAIIIFHRSLSAVDERYIIHASVYNASHIRSQQKINILITMPIDCAYNISKNMNRLQYDAHFLRVYWYFNVYNYETCSLKHNYSQLMEQKNNIKVIKHNILQSRFWSIYLKPDEIRRKFTTKMDYIWLINPDLMIEVFNFNAFMKLSMNFPVSITQPSIMSMCEHCRASDWWFLNHNSRRGKKHSNGLIAYTVPFIEMMAPLFTFEIWQTIHPLIYMQYLSVGKDLSTDWGEIWWCSVLRQTLNGSCVVIDYTPMIHMDTGAIQKTDEYKSQCQEMMNRLENHPIFSRFMPIRPPNLTLFEQKEYFMNESVDKMHYF